MDLGVHILLAHEMVGSGGQEDRHGCEFSSFFSCKEGATPTDLLHRGIYHEIAVALKGGYWRGVSYVLMHQELDHGGIDLRGAPIRDFALCEPIKVRRVARC